jgi:hypothetical protein
MAPLRRVLMDQGEVGTTNAHSSFQTVYAFEEEEDSQDQKEGCHDDAVVLVEPLHQG